MLTFVAGGFHFVSFLEVRNRDFPDINSCFVICTSVTLNINVLAVRLYFVACRVIRCRLIYFRDFAKTGKINMSRK